MGLNMALVSCLLIGCCYCLYHCWLDIWLWVVGFWVLLVCAFGITLFVRFMLVGLCGCCLLDCLVGSVVALFSCSG